MVIEIINFGPIKNFAFDLNKDFHLIVGQNNAGKSYAVTLIYLIIKTFHFMAEEGFGYFAAVRHAVQFDVSDESARKNGVYISDKLRGDVQQLLEKSFVLQLENSIKGTFNSIEDINNKRSNEGLRIVIRDVFFTMALAVKDKRLLISEFEINKKIKYKEIKQKRRLKTEDEIIIYSHPDDDSVFASNYVAAIYFLFFSVINSVHTICGNVHFLPASRSGLYLALSAFGQIVAELSRSRSFLSKKIELPGISEPLSDYFLKLSEIRVNRKNFEGKPVNKIAEKIENEILNGTVEFDSKTKRLFYSPKGTNLRLDLSSTSSMVSELSPVVSYLRYVLTQPEDRSRRLRILDPVAMYLPNVKSAGSLLIMEEPEAHLHPEVQVRLVNIFADLIGHDVKLIITSHSNYVFNKVNNLIISGQLVADNIEAVMVSNEDEGSICRRLDTDELGVDDDNFISVTESLYEEKMRLIDESNKG